MARTSEGPVTSMASMRACLRKGSGMALKSESREMNAAAACLNGEEDDLGNNGLAGMGGQGEDARGLAQRLQKDGQGKLQHDRSGGSAEHDEHGGRLSDLRKTAAFEQHSTHDRDDRQEEAAEACYIHRWCPRLVYRREELDR